MIARTTVESKYFISKIIIISLSIPSLFFGQTATIKTTYFALEEGLSQVYYNDLLQDGFSNNLRLVTNDCIIKFNTSEKKNTQYAITHRIQAKRFEINTKYRDQVIKPKENKFNSLSKTISKTRNIVFNCNPFPFSLCFSSKDFRLNKNVTDTEWHPLKDTEIQFLNLPYRTYIILANIFIKEKEKSKSPLDIQLIISTPWCLFLIYAILLTLIGYAFYRFQISKKMSIAENLRLKDAQQLKNTMYTNIAHELRTPLLAILNVTNNMKAEAVEEKPLEMIESNSIKLLCLVNEMLDLAKVESGKMELQMIQADIIPFIKQLTERVHPLATDRKIQLVIYSEVEHLKMDFDSNKLASIITHLLSNVINFTNENEKIIVHIDQIKKERTSFLNIKIKNNGVGISEKELPHIFDKIYQINNSLFRKSERTGIRLSLVKELVALLNGTITVKNTRTEGSAFLLEIPISQKATKKEIDKTTIIAPSPIASSFKSDKNILSEDSELPLILIIENNEDVAQYLKTCLHSKYRTIHAQNGQIGIDMALKTIPNVIISDVMIPKKNGIEVCETIKTDERTDHIPFIMLITKATTKDKLTGISKGADAYLPKSFLKTELFTHLDQLIALQKKKIQKFDNDQLGKLLKKKVTDPETKFLQKTIQFIHSDIGNPNFGTSQLASKLLLSESQVYRKLKAISGKSTAVFIRSIRLQQAKELIQSTNMTISEVAYKVGFNDPSWFSRIFKEEFGFPPSSIHKN